MSCYINLERKLQHVGHKWVIYGSHLDCSVGQMGQQVRPIATDFQPWIGSYVYALIVRMKHHYKLNSEKLDQHNS